MLLAIPLAHKKSTHVEFIADLRGNSLFYIYNLSQPALQKILIIRFSSIGDIVLTTPVVRCVKNQVENAEVHYLTKAGFAHLLEANPHVDKVHSFIDDLGAVIDLLKKEAFDFVIDLHNNIRSRRVTTSLGVKHKRFHKLNTEKWMMVNLKVDKLPDVHIVDRYIDTTADLGVKNDGKGLDFFIPKKEEVDPSILPEGFQNDFIALVIGAQHFTKKLPEHKLSELIALLPDNVLIIGGPEDAEIGERLQKAHSEKAWNACGKFNLFGSASLIKQSKSVISHDTGMMHIAAALQKPIVSLWGNTIPKFGMYPYLPEHQDRYSISEVKKLSCRPCSKIGHDACPKGHFKCMEEQALATIVKDVAALSPR
ncbi:MAG: ADP-heptose:LPS heptosyltransferase [Bacteroidia bacterium]